MTDAPVVHIGENSPEQVAWKLMQEIVGRESHNQVTREIILDCYAECLEAVKGRRTSARRKAEKEQLSRQFS